MIPAFGLLLIIVPLILILILAFEIWMFVDLIQNPRLSTEMKMLWGIGMIFFHPVIAIVYYLVARSNHL